MKIIFDTNFLMLPFTHRVDVFDEAARVCPEKAEFFVLRASLGELANVKGSDRMAAKAAVAYLERNSNGVEFVDGSGKPDAQILGFVKANAGCVVATSDADLKRKVRAAGGRVLTLRSLTHLELE
ncbi:MAG: hypothetical protein V1708_05500 [Candidatus Micrarchaeota archaeon]